MSEKIKLTDFLEKIGFEKYHTGGGCMSLRFGMNQDPEGPEILITDEEGVSIDVMEGEVEVGQRIWIGFYSDYESGEWITFESRIMGFSLGGEEMVDVDSLTTKGETE